MTSPPPDEPRRREWWARPQIVLPLIAALVIFVALVTPQETGSRSGDPRLSSHLTGPLNARLVYDVAGRLGWQVSRRDSLAIPAALPRGSTIHAVLSPSMPLLPREAHAYLEAVRGGDALLLVLDDERQPLSDSLGVRTTTGDLLEITPSDTVGCRAGFRLVPPLWPDDKVRLWGLRWTRRASADRIVFAVQRSQEVQGERQREVAAGFPLGRGRVVVVSDPDLLRNDVIRRCSYGADVRVVRMLEWLRDGGVTPRTSLVFDEYHHGFGPHASVTGTTGHFLVAHPIGRTILQVALAALVLLLAVSPRPIPPAAVEREQRRDPLEQIDALAHAYEQVHATRTVATRLLHGVRSRVERGWSPARGRSDDAFLDDLARDTPTLAPEVELVRRALREPIPDRMLPELGAALGRIERTLTPRQPHDTHR